MSCPHRRPSHRRGTEAPQGPESSPGVSTLCRLGLPVLGSGLNASSAGWQPPRS